MKGESLKDRIVGKVILTADDCWEWAGSKTQTGYGEMRVGTRKNNKLLRVHRVAYEEFIGPIPEGLEIDHLCRKRDCVNPWHLEPVTHAENMARGEWALKTLCPQGHPYSHRNPKGSRECRECRRESERRRRERLRKERSAA